MSAWSAFLTWIEASALGELVRSSGVWTYGVLNLLHILGIAALFGAVLVLDLHLLGWRRQLGSVGSVIGMTVPISVGGFLLAASSGACLLATNATEYLGNPFLPIKFTAIAFALLNALIATRLPVWKRAGQSRLTPSDQRQFAIVGGVSLLFWLSAISAGRMIGYW